MLELWGIKITHLLSSLPGRLWPGLVATYRVLSMGQNELWHLNHVIKQNFFEIEMFIHLTMCKQMTDFIKNMFQKHIQRLRTPQRVSCYDAKNSEGEIWIMLKLCEYGLIEYQHFYNYLKRDFFKNTFHLTITQVCFSWHINIRGLFNATFAFLKR